MIEIINWWNSLGVDIKIAIGFIILIFIGLFYDEFITFKIRNKDKRKTFTQKYREGLIKK